MEQEGTHIETRRLNKNVLFLDPLTCRGSRGFLNSLMSHHYCSKPRYETERGKNLDLPSICCALSAVPMMWTDLTERAVRTCETESQAKGARTNHPPQGAEEPGRELPKAQPKPTKCP